MSETIDVEATRIETPADPFDAVDVQEAAVHYTKMLTMVKGYSSVMNGKGLARVLVALAEFPYGDAYPKFKKGSEEQKLFTFMLSLQSAKAKIAEALKADMQTIHNKAIDNVVTEIQTETKET